MLAVSGWPVAWWRDGPVERRLDVADERAQRPLGAEQRERQRGDLRAEAGDALEQGVDRRARREQAAEDRRRVAARAAAGVGVPDRAVRLPGVEQRLRLEQRVVVADGLAQVAQHRGRVGERAGLAVAGGHDQARAMLREPVVQRAGRRAVDQARVELGIGGELRLQRQRDRPPHQAGDVAAAVVGRPHERALRRGARALPVAQQRVDVVGERLPGRAAGARPRAACSPRTGAPTGWRRARRRSAGSGGRLRRRSRARRRSARCPGRRGAGSAGAGGCSGAAGRRRSAAPGRPAAVGEQPAGAARARPRRGPWRRRRAPSRVRRARGPSRRAGRASRAGRPPPRGRGA